MALTLGTDTYITLADARSYVTQNGLDPLPAVDADAEALLRRATLSLDRLYGNKYIGIKILIGQPLAWPRLFPFAQPHGPGEWPFIQFDSDGNARDFSTLQPETGWATVELAGMIQKGIDIFSQPAPTVIRDLKKVDTLMKEQWFTGYTDRPLYKISLILRPLLEVISAVPITRGA